MDILPKPQAPKKRRKYRLTPGTMGYLVDLYEDVRMRYSVIDSSFTPLTKENQKEVLEEILATAYEYSQDITLPSWKLLPDNLKQVVRIASCGLDPHAIALTSNLSPRVARTAMKANKGTAYYLAQIIRQVLHQHGIEPKFAFTVELADRVSRNSPLHIHGTLIIPFELRDAVMHDLRLALAKDYVQTAGHQAVQAKPIRTAGGWARYCTKQKKATVNVLSKPDYASQSTSQSGMQLYQELRTWLRDVPSPKPIVQEARPRPVINERGRALIAFIENYRHEKKARQARARRERKIKQARDAIAECFRTTRELLIELLSPFLARLNPAQ